MKPRKSLRLHPGRTRQKRYEHLQVLEALKYIPEPDPEELDNQELEARISAAGAHYERYLVASAERQAKSGGES